MDLAKLINPDYLWAAYPPAGFSQPFRIALLVLFIGSILLAIYAGKKPKKITGPIKGVWRRLQIWGWSNGLTGLFLVLVRESRAIYLSSRFWLLLWLIIAFIWLLMIIIYWQKTIPRRQAEAQRQAELNKYLPHKK